jgi:hypothetical protein
VGRRSRQQRDGLNLPRLRGARSKRQTRRLRLLATDDELRQLDRGQRGRGKGRKYDDD